METFQGTSIVVLDTLMIEKYENRGIEARLVQLLKEMVTRKKIASLRESSRKSIADRIENNFESENESKIKMKSVSKKVDINNKSEKENKNDKLFELKSKLENGNKSLPGHWSIRNIKQTNPPASLAIWQTLVLSAYSPPSSSSSSSSTSSFSSPDHSVENGRNRSLVIPNFSSEIPKKVVRFSSQNQSSDEQKNIECE
jgi:hypothetical protein